MKVSIKCDCLVLEASLKLFLKDKICSQNESDFVICDRVISASKPLFIIGSDIKIPFTKDELLNSLRSFETNLLSVQNKTILQARISKLMDKFKTDLLNLVLNAK